MRIKASCYLASILMATLAVQPVIACLWDKDTLAMERQRFPAALELITGKFARHSEEFYRWRIQDRLEKLKTSPAESSYYDDLAVAYDKTGQQDKAIEVMLRKKALKPGLYETYANLGTFYIHAGQYARGLQYIDKAIAINPNAHFEREVYQRHLVEYVMSRMQDGRVTLPLSKEPAMRGDIPLDRGFLVFLMNTQGRRLSKEEGRAAVKGILGMMRFGNYRSPILLEALGDLLYRGGEGFDDAKQLAARAYLKASYEASDEASKEAYRQLAADALSIQIKVVGRLAKPVTLAGVEKNFRKELADAERWYARVRSDELNWINRGMDPEREFDRKYYSDPPEVKVKQAMPARKSRVTRTN